MAKSYLPKNESEVLRKSFHKEFCKYSYLGPSACRKMDKFVYRMKEKGVNQVNVSTSVRYKCKSMKLIFGGRDLKNAGKYLKGTEGTIILEGGGKSSKISYDLGGTIEMAEEEILEKAIYVARKLQERYLEATVEGVPLSEIEKIVSLKE